MLWNIICTSFKNGWLSFALFIVTIVFAIIWGIVICIHHKRDRKITIIRILFVGTFVSALFYFLPIMQEILGAQGGREFWLDSILTSAQFAFRLFILDGEILWIFDEELSILSDPAVKDFYTLFGSFLYVIAPILTFGFVLTFFNNLFSRLAYFFGFLCPTHVFSELNEKSVALASDLRKNNIFNVIVFTDISEKVLEEKMELVEDARMLGAILFSKDFDSIKYRGKVSLRKINFYLISDDEEKKLRHAEVVVKNFDYKNVELRIFSSNIRSELLIASFDTKKMRAIRVDDIQTLVYHNLYTNGKMLFEKAREIPGEKDKVISAVIVGLGQYGKEMLKALTWFCQLDGYKLKITAFDSDEHAEEKFKFKCPELMAPNYNGNYENNGEPRYEIKIHGGIDASTPEFKKHLEEIKDATYIFVCLGDDETNLKTAVDVRTICESIQYLGDAKHKPNIETVIYDSRLASSIRTSWDAIAANEKKGVLNHKKSAYNILVTGDLDSFYSVSTLVDSKLIEAGYKIHHGYTLKYAKDDFELAKKEKNPIKATKELLKRLEKSSRRSFWKYEYNHNSSIARAIHRQLRIDMGQYPDINNWDELDHDEKVVIANPEHIRWSAYMRSKGYCKGERNDLGKTHNNLVPTDQLNDDDLEKD